MTWSESGPAYGLRGVLDVRPLPPRISRTPAELPEAAREALARLSATSPLASAYRSAPAAEVPSTFYPVTVRGAAAPGPGAFFWPTVRTAIPGSISAALVLSLVGAPGALGALGTAGVLLGSAVTALFARTQYTLERDQQALCALWLATDGTSVLVARFDTLAARATGRARFALVPVEALAPQESPHAVSSFAPFARAQRRAARIAHALAALGLPGASVGPLEAQLVHTLARLGRLRRHLAGRARG